MTVLAWWLLAAALALIALLCAHLASCATLVLQLLELDEATRRLAPLVGLRPRWIGQRRMRAATTVYGVLGIVASSSTALWMVVAGRSVLTL